MAGLHFYCDKIRKFVRNKEKIVIFPFAIETPLSTEPYD